MTEHDIQRISNAVVEKLLSDDRFAQRIERMSRRKNHMIDSSRAASVLGLSADRLRRIAPYIGGIKKGGGKQSQWSFEEDGLKERYICYINSK